MGATAATAAQMQVMSYMAYEAGGVIPGISGQAVPIIAHAKETVLPENMTRKLNAASGEGNAGHTINLSDNPTVNTIDSKGMADTLREHGETLGNIFADMLRKKNLA